jgi:hypothetical protein
MGVAVKPIAQVVSAVPGDRLWLLPHCRLSGNYAPVSEQIFRIIICAESI